MKYNITKEELIQKYITENYTIAQCADYFGCSKKPVSNAIKKYGIHKKLSHQTIMKMTDEMYEVLRGAMLGDGSLLVQNKSANAHLSYTSKSLQHVQFIAKYFEEYQCGKGITSKMVYDKRTGKSYERNTFLTNRSITLTEEINKWYINKIKHIPSDLVLTPLTCLVWYIGDGGITKITDKANGQAISLSTNCFEKEEIENILLPQLSQFDARIAKAGIGKNGQRQYVIRIYKKENIIKFLEYIGPCPFDDYRYKWDVAPDRRKNLDQYFDEWDQLRRMHFSAVKIATLYECDSHTVREKFKLHGVRFLNAYSVKRLPCSDWEQLYKNGKSFDEIGNLYDCSPKIIERYINYIQINGNKAFVQNKK